MSYREPRTEWGGAGEPHLTATERRRRECLWCPPGRCACPEPVARKRNPHTDLPLEDPGAACWADLYDDAMSVR